MYDQQKEGVPFGEKYPGASAYSAGLGHLLITGQRYEPQLGYSKEQQMQILMRSSNYGFLGKCRGSLDNTLGGWGVNT